MNPQQLEKIQYNKRVWQKHIGAQIRHHRLEQKRSLKQLAARTGLSMHMLDLYECGRSEMQLVKLMAIAHALRISPLQLLAGWPLRSNGT